MSRAPLSSHPPSRPAALLHREPAAVQSGLAALLATLALGGWLVLGAWLLFAGCAAMELSCRVGADCASGACGADGRCLPLADGGGPADGSVTTDGPATGDGGADGASGGDGGPGSDDGPATDVGPAPDLPEADLGGSCRPDQDGTVTRAEMPLRAGLRATFRVARDAEVDTAGETSADGTRRWDLGGPLNGDHGVLVETLPLEGMWFAKSFPGATYAARLSDSSDLLGVFEITDEALLLRGVVSPEDGLGRTELTYDPPVETLRFPLAVGETFATDATVSGVALGVGSFYSESYQSQVDARGELVTPFGTFPVLRVRVQLDRTIGLVSTRIRSFLFVAECFGTVAAITSRDNEPVVEFSRAAEVRRLSP